MRPLLLALAALLALPALAAPADSADSAIALISEGDRARYAGDRAEAVRLYRAAVEAGDPAAEAMARLRLLGLTGNLGALWHGPALDRALRASEGPWGQIAWADYHLFAPRQVGADPAEGDQIAAGAAAALPSPAAARRYLATGDPSQLAALESAAPGDAGDAHGDAPRDGLGDALVAGGGRLPPEPGTWFLGLGAAGAPGAGFGGAVTFVHPDLFWRRWTLSTSAAGTSRGTAALSASLRSPGGPLGGRLYGVSAASAYRQVADLYLSGVPIAYLQRGYRLQAGPGVGLGSWRLQAGGALRRDDVGFGPLDGHGAWGSVAWDRRRGVREHRRGAYAALSADLSLADYAHLGLFADARGFVGALGGVTAGRLTWQEAALDGAPFYRLPTAGGAEVHRGAWAGRWRASRIAAVDLEQRWPLGGALEAAVFANAAWVVDEGVHPGGGAGIRLILPPEALNVVRLDAAVSDTGWGVYCAWGEAF